jgi:transcriptional regulator with XRE-family HTH domain
MVGIVQPVGELLRSWRQRRRLSQLDLACEAEISTRHLSFLETGRSLPSREMLLRLAEQLAVPLRERNALLIAAGYAPVYPERRLDDPALRAARQVIDLVLAGHEPCPALAIDRHWTLVAANQALPLLLTALPARCCAHLSMCCASVCIPMGSRRGSPIWPSGARMSWTSFPAPAGRHGADHGAPHGGIAVPFRLATESGVLSFLSTTTVFGTPLDITLSEVAVESFFPADAATDAMLRAGLRTSRASV